MGHDNRRNGCQTSNTDHYLYLMQNQLMAVSPLMKWSNCSKRAITEFIEYVSLNIDNFMYYLMHKLHH